VDLAITGQSRLRQGVLDKAHAQMLTALAALGGTGIEGRQKRVVDASFNALRVDVSSQAPSRMGTALTHLKDHNKVVLEHRSSIFL
jgi:hypothetical protein